MMTQSQKRDQEKENEQLSIEEGEEGLHDGLDDDEAKDTQEPGTV